MIFRFLIGESEDTMGCFHGPHMTKEAAIKVAGLLATEFKETVSVSTVANEIKHVTIATMIPPVDNGLAKENS